VKRSAGFIKRGQLTLSGFRQFGQPSISNLALSLKKTMRYLKIRETVIPKLVTRRTNHKFKSPPRRSGRPVAAETHQEPQKSPLRNNTSRELGDALGSEPLMNPAMMGVAGQNAG
jgi:hypothetical protein